MKSKERQWALTKENPIHEVKKDHESPKSQKEGNNNNNNKEKKKRISVRPEDMQQGYWSKDMQQEEHQGPMTLMCPFEALRRRPWLAYGKVKVYVHISSKNRYYFCNPWSKPVGSQVDSKGEMVWSIGE